MSLLTQIKADQLQARKDKDTVKASLLTTLLGDINTAAINGKAELSDIEICKIVKKFLNGVDVFIGLSPDKPELYIEKEILESYLPIQLTVEALTTIINSIVADIEKPNIGSVLKELRSKYDGLFDGAIASGIVKSVLG